MRQREDEYECKGTVPINPQTRIGHIHLKVADLERALAFLNAGVSLDGASDHGVAEALYLRDPDGSSLELYRDRPPKDWPRNADGQLAMINQPLDLDDLLKEAPSAI